MTDSQRDRRRDYVRGVPAMTDEITDRLELLLTGPDDADAHVNMLKRSDVHRLLYNLADSLAQYGAAVKKEQTSSEEIRELVISAVDKNQRQLDEQARQIEAAKSKYSWARNIAAAALTIAIPALGAVFWKILDAKEAEGERRIEIRVLQDEVNRLRAILLPGWPVAQQKDKP